MYIRNYNCKIINSCCVQLQCARYVSPEYQEFVDTVLPIAEFDLNEEDEHSSF